MPLKVMNNERALWKYIVFGIITCGIYPIIFWSGIGEDLNIAAMRRDGRNHALLPRFLPCSARSPAASLRSSGITRCPERLGSEARARGFATNLSAATSGSGSCSAA